MMAIKSKNSKAIYGFILLCMGQFSLSAQTGKFSLKGSIPAWKGKETVALRYSDNGKQIADTVIALQGKFQFSGKINQQEPVSATVILISRDGHGMRDNRSFYMDKGLITVNGQDSLRYAKVLGSKITAENEVLIGKTTPILNRLVALRIKAGKTNKEAQKTPEFEALNTEYKIFVDSMINTKTAFIKAYPKSFVSLVTLESVAGSPIDYPRANALFSVLSPELKLLPAGQKMAASLLLAKNTSIGMVLPDFSSLDTLRQPLSLKEVVDKSKVTLVDFWASWCAPCRAENPNVVKAFKAFHEKGFNILSVSLDKTEASWKKAIAADGMPWYHVSGLKYWDEPVALQFGIHGVPDNFLLDGEGKVVARGLRGDALYQKIAQTIQVADSLKGMELRRNYLYMDSVIKTFEREKEAGKRVLILERFVATPINERSYKSYISWMQRDLAEQYASLNDVASSDQWLNQINGEREKMEAVRLAAIAYAGAGNVQKGVGMLKPTLDSLLNADAKIKRADLNLYSNTVGAFVKVLKPAGNEQELLHYLQPLYEINGQYFPSDLSGRLQKSDQDFKQQLFYSYAKAVSAKGNAREVAQILSGAFTIGSVPQVMQKDVANDFSDLKDLGKYLREFEASGKASFEKNLNGLLTKSDLNGQALNRSELKGKYVLLDFWGSWCLPCRFTHPHLKEAYSKYKSKGFEIIGIATEASPDLEKARISWKKAVKEDQIGWIQILNNENVDSFDAVKVFGIGVFPTKILLNPEGKEIARYSGGASTEFDAKLKEIFGS